MMFLLHSEGEYVYIGSRSLMHTQRKVIQLPGLLLILTTHKTICSLLKT